MHQGKSVKSPRFDHEGEYLLGESGQFLKDHGIISQNLTPGSLQQDGVAERRYKNSLRYGKTIG